MNKRYQVFVSSTYADLREERSKVIQTIMELDCLPAGMEIFPAIDEEQFNFIKRIIDDCDYYLLIIGGRYGSLSASMVRVSRTTAHNGGGAALMMAQASSVPELKRSKSEEM